MPNALGPGKRFTDSLSRYFAWTSCSQTHDGAPFMSPYKPCWYSVSWTMPACWSVWSLSSWNAQSWGWVCRLSGSNEIWTWRNSFRTCLKSLCGNWSRVHGWKTPWNEFFVFWLSFDWKWYGCFVWRVAVYIIKLYYWWLILLMHDLKDVELIYWWNMLSYKKPCFNAFFNLLTR